MKNITSICCAVFLSACTSLFAQAPLGEGNKQLNAGFGFSSWGVPIYAGLDFGIHPDVTIGPQVSFRSYSENYNFNGSRFNYSHSIFVFGFNGNYHFNSLLNISSQFDFYAGATVGYYIWSSPSDYIGNRSSGIGLDAQVGGRYFFSDQWALNIEFGGGTASGGKIGITYEL